MKINEELRVKLNGAIAPFAYGTISSKVYAPTAIYDNEIGRLIAEYQRLSAEKEKR